MLNKLINLFAYTGPVPQKGQIWDIPRRPNDCVYKRPVEFFVVDVAPDGSWFKVQSVRTQETVTLNTKKWAPKMRLRIH